MLLVHPNIITFFGAALGSQKLPVLVTGRIETLLSDLVHHVEKFSMKEVVGIATDIANALSFLHARGIAHGALRAESIVISGFMSAQISDMCEASVLMAASAPFTPQPEVSF